MKTQSIITAAIVGLAVSLFTSCEKWGLGCVDGNGRLTTEERITTDFAGIEVNGSFDVFVDTGSQTSVLIEADENLLDHIKTKVRGNNLVIDTYRDRCLRSDHRIIVHVSTPQIEEIILNGSGKINCSRFQATEVSVKLRGSGNIDLSYAQVDEARFELSGSGLITGAVDAYSADLLLEGSGEIRIDGSAHVADMDIIGSGNIKTGNLTVDNCKVNITGSGNAYVFAYDFLEAKITGSGTVYYYGNPSNVVKNITGSGKIIKR